MMDVGVSEVSAATSTRYRLHWKERKQTNRDNNNFVDCEIEVKSNQSTNKQRNNELHTIARTHTKKS